VNKSADTTSSQETWNCYKPEYHYGSTKDWIVDHIRHKETQGKKVLSSTECKINKLGAAVITRGITLIFPGTCEIFMKPGSATSHSVNMAA